MNTINNSIHIQPQEIQNKQTNRTHSTKSVEKMSKEDIISSDLSVDEKLEKLGIKPMNLSELSEKLAGKLIDGDI